jgi:hypothetical protein
MMDTTEPKSRDSGSAQNHRVKLTCWRDVSALERGKVRLRDSKGRDSMTPRRNGSSPPRRRRKVKRGFLTTTYRIAKVELQCIIDEERGSSLRLMLPVSQSKTTRSRNREWGHARAMLEDTSCCSERNSMPSPWRDTSERNEGLQKRCRPRLLSWQHFVSCSSPARSQMPATRINDLV